MTILIINPLHLFNLGEIVLQQVAVNRLKKMWPEAEVFVVTTCPDRFKRFFPDVTAISKNAQATWVADNNLIWPLLFLVPSRWIPGWVVAIQKWICIKMPQLACTVMKLRFILRGHSYSDLDLYVRILSKTDLIVVTGSSSITDLWRNYAMHVLNVLELAIRHKIPTIMFSQGFGPLKDQKLNKKAASILPEVNIIALREKGNSLPLLEALGVAGDRIFVTGDDSIESAFKLKNGKREAMIGIHIRASDQAGFTNINSEIIGRIRKPLQNTANDLGAKLLPLPISTWKDDHDLAAIRQLLSGCSYIQDAELDFQSPEQLMQHVAKCRIVVSGSYQISVYALSQGIPAICLTNSTFYDNKFLGLSEQFGSGCYILSLGDEKAPEQLVELIHTAWDLGPSIHKKLIASAQQQIHQSKKMYEKVTDLYNFRH